jgi:hypothetical protein
MTSLDTAITTIKVPRYLRDYLKRSAKKHDDTMAEYLESIVKRDQRDQRLARLRRDLQISPPDRTYRCEIDQWDAIASEGLDEY